MQGDPAWYTAGKRPGEGRTTGREGCFVKRYEYKAVLVNSRFGIDYEKKVDAMVDEWNELGRQGWKFLTWANGAMLFMREVEE